MKLSFLAGAALAAGAAAGAHAQNWADEPREGWGLELGAGALVAPTYQGDDSYRLSILPNIRVTYGDLFFASVQEGAGLNLVNREGLRAGPLLRIAFSRDEDGDQPFAVTGDDSDDLIGLGEVDFTPELGGFVEYEFGAFAARAEIVQGLGGHEGLVADLSLDARTRTMGFGPPVIVSAGPRLRLVDADYNQSYFGVDAAQSLASGLPVYDADGGLFSYGVGGAAIMPLGGNGRTTLVAFAGYDRLTGDAADAPLVRLRGSEDQLSAGIFLSYRFF